MRRQSMLNPEFRVGIRYKPEGSTPVEHPNGDKVAVAYVGERNGKPYACAYRGTASRSEFYHTYRTVEQRDKAVSEWFAGIDSHLAFKEKMKAERKQKLQAFKASGETQGDYSLTETAALIRKTLKDIYHATKFSVRSEPYSGGCSIDVSWTDGPTQQEVQRILDHFRGADFDGMQDLKTYCDAYEWNGRRVKFHVDYVFGQRTESEALLIEAADRVSYETGLPMPVMVHTSTGHAYFEGDGGRVPFRYFPQRDYDTEPSCNDLGEPGVISHDRLEGEWYHQLVYQVARATSKEAPVARPNLPAYVTEAYIDDVVAKLLREAD